MLHLLWADIWSGGDRQCLLQHFPVGSCGNSWIRNTYFVPEQAGKEVELDCLFSANRSVSTDLCTPPGPPWSVFVLDYTYRIAFMDIPCNISKNIIQGGESRKHRR